MYGIVKKSQSQSLKFGINDGFYFEDIKWNDEPDRPRAELSFRTSALQFPLITMMWEPDRAFDNSTIDDQKERQAEFLTAVATAFVPFETLKEKIKPTKSLSEYVTQLRNIIPADAKKKELEIVLRYGRRGYLEVPSSLAGLDTNVVRVKDSDQPELIVSDWFTEKYGKKPEVPGETTETRNKWGV